MWKRENHDMMNETLQKKNKAPQKQKTSSRKNKNKQATTSVVTKKNSPQGHPQGASGVK